MGFTGAVVSDYEGIEQLQQLHYVEPDLLHAAARRAARGRGFRSAGRCCGLREIAAKPSLRVSLRKHRSIRQLRRMLRMKFLAGLFENPYADARVAQSITNNTEARAPAGQAARKATVLLKNDGTLPLRAANLEATGRDQAQRRKSGSRRLLKRTRAHRQCSRGHCGQTQRPRTRGERRGRTHYRQRRLVLGRSCAGGRGSLALKRIQEAVKVARDADEYRARHRRQRRDEPRRLGCGNPLGDRSDLGLIAQQDDLARAMFALGKPVVVLLINGAPLSIPEVAEKANAILEGWYPGQEGGTALADILFGDSNPGGKLPVTIARSSGQLPMFYNQKPSAHRGYLFASREPLFPFGFGLSYTARSEISSPHLSAQRDRGGSIRNGLG